MIQPLLYSESRALSQSDIKLFRRDLLRYFNEVERGDRLEDTRTTSTDIGNVVDVMLTDEKSLSLYEVVDQVACSPAIKEIMEEAFTNMRHAMDDEKIKMEERMRRVTDVEEYKGYILAAARAKEYQTRWGDEAIINTLTKNGGKYFETIAKFQGKNVIDRKTYDRAAQCADKIRKDPYTGKIFRMGAEGMDIVMQRPLFGTYMDIPQKILPDIYLAHHDRKIIWPFDIKTALTMARFLKNYYRFGYGYQGSYYNDVLEQNYPGYKVYPFRFIVGSTDDAASPMIYEMKSSELMMYADGGFTRDGRRIIGWKESMSEIAWHRKTSQWEYPKSYYEKGIMIIDSVYSEESDNDII